MNKKVFTLGIMLLTFISEAAERRRHEPNPVISGTFYSMQRDMPPLPFNPFPELPVITVSKGVFVYDDSSVDYSARQAMIATVEEEPLPNFALMDFGANLYISSMTANGELIHVSIANAAIDTAYDVYYTPTLNPGFYWRLYFRGATNQTEFDLAKPASPHGFFVVGSANDTDGDGLSDGFESLVTGTDPNLLDSDNKSAGTLVPNVLQRGVRLTRKIDGIPVWASGGLEVRYGEHGRIYGLELVWRTVKPLKEISVPAPSALVDQIKAGQALVRPTDKWPVKRLVINKAQLYYREREGSVRQRRIDPFMGLTAETDLPGERRKLDLFLRLVPD